MITESSQTSLKTGQTRLRLCREIIVVLTFSLFLNIFALGLPIYSMQVFDRVLPSSNLATLFVLSALMATLIFCTTLLEGSRANILIKSSYEIDRQIYGYVASRLSALELKNVGTLRDIDTVRVFLASPLAAALLDTPWSIVFLVAIFSVHSLLGWLTVIATVLVVLVAGVGHSVSHKRKLDASSMIQNSQDILDAGRTNRTVMTAMGMQSGMFERASALRFAGLRSLGAVSERQAWFDAVGRGVRSALQVAVLALAAILAVNGDVQAGSIVAASMLFGRAIAPVERIAAGIPILHRTWKAWRRLNEMIRSPNGEAKKLRLPAIEGRIAVEHLYFNVPGHRLPIINNVCFEVRPGEVVLVVGPEGSGKSVLAQLLANALQPSSGIVRLDGSNTADFDPCDLGRQTGFLSEDVRLDIGSISQTIARDETPDSALVVAAATLAGAHDLIQELPSGYQTCVGPGAYILSAGQRKRIALARALYRYPRYLILDEPTTQLDDVGETAVVNAITEMKRRGSTIIVVSRLRHLLHLADRVIMLEQGRLVLNQGHAELQAYLKPRLAS